MCLASGGLCVLFVVYVVVVFGEASAIEKFLGQCFEVVKIRV